MVRTFSSVVFAFVVVVDGGKREKRDKKKTKPLCEKSFHFLFMKLFFFSFSCHYYRQQQFEGTIQKMPPLSVLPNNNYKKCSWHVVQFFLSFFFFRLAEENPSKCQSLRSNDYAIKANCELIYSIRIYFPSASSLMLLPSHKLDKERQYNI